MKEFEKFKEIVLKMCDVYLKVKGINAFKEVEFVIKFFDSIIEVKEEGREGKEQKLKREEKE